MTPMTEEASSPAITPPHHDGMQPRKIEPFVVYVVGWLLGWPAVLYVVFPLPIPIGALQACLLAIGSLAWLISVFIVLLLLFIPLFCMIEKRWPVLAEILVGLGRFIAFVFRLARILVPHH